MPKILYMERSIFSLMKILISTIFDFVIFIMAILACAHVALNAAKPKVKEPIKVKRVETCEKINKFLICDKVEK